MMPKIIEGSGFSSSSVYGGGGTREGFAGKEEKKMAYAKYGKAVKDLKTPKKPRKI